jgi:uncharacterized protein
MWEVTEISKTPKIKEAILISGLPGIGNTGKIAVDFLLDQLKPKELCDFYSYHLPHSVFINEDNLVELPKIRLGYVKTKKGPDLLLLFGDIQPIDESSSHAFANLLLDMCQKMNVKTIITLGGIGMSQMPKDPKVYVTGNSKEIVKEYKLASTRTKIRGIVGPIIGLTGLLVGLAKKYDIPSVTYLSESFAHPLHIGTREAGELLKILKEKLSLKIDLKKFKSDLKNVEKKARITKKDQIQIKSDNTKRTSYIG